MKTTDQNKEFELLKANFADLEHAHQENFEMLCDLSNKILDYTFALTDLLTRANHPESIKKYGQVSEKTTESIYDLNYYLRKIEESFNRDLSGKQM